MPCHQIFLLPHIFPLTRQPRIGCVLPLRQALAGLPALGQCGGNTTAAYWLRQTPWGWRHMSEGHRAG